MNFSAAFTAGTVKDVTVVESTSSLFDRAAVNAALKFKYKPRVVDGGFFGLVFLVCRVSSRLTRTKSTM